MMEPIRLQKYIAECGVASRRAAETMIENGRVTVNGKRITALGTKIDSETDRVTVDGIEISPERKKYYIMLHKPVGYVTTSKDQFDRKTVLDLVQEDISARLYPVGRLDYDTSGLLFLTNDGDFTYSVTHPKYEIEKTYQALVKGTPGQAALQQLAKGVTIDGKKTATARVTVKKDYPNACLLEITIHEGRNRQVRKMCEAVGHPVMELKRINFGGIGLGNLPVGKWRHLTVPEITILKGGKI